MEVIKEYFYICNINKDENVENFQNNITFIKENSLKMH